MDEDRKGVNSAFKGSPNAVVWKFLQSLKVGDIGQARTFLTPKYAEQLRVRGVDLTKFVGFLLDPGWEYSRERRRIRHKVEHVVMVYGLIPENHLVSDPRSTYTIELSDTSGRWRISLFGVPFPPDVPCGSATPDPPQTAAPDSSTSGRSRSSSCSADDPEHRMLRL